MAEALRTAAGISDAELAELVLHSPPSREEVTASSGSTRNIEVRSSGPSRAFGARRARWAFGANWLTALLLASGVAVGALAGLHRGRGAGTARAVASSSTTNPLPPTTPASAPTIAVVLSTAAVPSSANLAVAPAPAMSSATHPSHTRRVKPVATTPGF